MTDVSDGRSADVWSRANAGIASGYSHSAPYTRSSNESLHSGLVLRWESARRDPAAIIKQASAALATKRLMDIVMSLGALLLLLPLLVAVAVAIKVTSDGPVLLRQQRTGKDGELFWLLKFRSMYMDHTDHSGVAQTTRDDPRVTPFGRLIRRTSIDELPQLLNVLVGHMSIVGPRPHVPDMLAGGMSYSTLVPYYDCRHAMRPGLTGWAQANGFRGPTDDPALARARVDHDLAYIQNFSIWLDIRIVWTTLKREFMNGTGV